MKQDEFAFFNQQLAVMLRDGIPLEGALRRLCQDMRKSSLRDELLAFEGELANGVPLIDALAPRQLPELYKRMVMVGVKSGDLPGALTMLADYFQRQSNLQMRLKGLMVYPLIVLFAAFLISCFLAYILGAFIWNNLEAMSGYQNVSVISTGLWMSPVCIGLALAAAIITISCSPMRRMLRWRLPAFREASLAQVGSVMWLMLKNGVSLNDALGLVEQLEKGTLAEKEIARWRQRLAAGHGKFTEIAAVSTTKPSPVFPPLFIWTVAQAGEDLTAGFQRVAELYQSRAMYRTELLLYSALPCSILALAAMIACQITPIFAVMTTFIRCLSGDGM